MRVLIFLIGCSMILSFSCDQTNDYLDEFNSPPLLNSSSQDSLEAFSDSVKFLLDPFITYYNIELSLYDENDNIKGFRYQLISGVGELYQGESRVLNNEVEINHDVLYLRYSPANIGEHKMRLTVSDDFGESSSVLINLVVFENIPPTSILYYNKLGVNSNYEYELIGKESFDGDKKYGGKIKLYEYTLQNKRIETTKPVITHVFPGIEEGASNIYRVGLRVKDQNDVWSSQSVVNIDLSI